MSNETGNAVGRFFGAILMVVGGLITFLSGACTLTFAGIGIVGGLQEGHLSQGMSIIPMALALGLPGVGIGLVLFFVGRGLYRRVT